MNKSVSTFTQYSVDSNEWVNIPYVGNQYVRFSIDNGKTYPVVLFYSGEGKPQIRTSYSSNLGAWYSSYSDSYYFIRFSVDNGSIWSGGVRIRDYITDNQYGEDTRIEFSENNSGWHSVYKTGDKFIRFSVDGGKTYTKKVSYTGDSVNQFAVSFSSTGEITSSANPKYAYFVRFTVDGGLTWSGVIRLKNYEIIYQYSAYKDTDFHETYINKEDKYMRYSVDEGETWSDGYPILVNDTPGLSYRMPLNEDAKVYPYGSDIDLEVVGNFGILEYADKTSSTCKRYDSEQDFTVDTYTFYCDSVSCSPSDCVNGIETVEQYYAKIDKSGNGSKENPWKNLCYALEQLECIFNIACTADFKIVVKGIVDYPISVIKRFSPRGEPLYTLNSPFSFVGLDNRPRKPMFLDMAGASIVCDIPYLHGTGNPHMYFEYFNGFFIVQKATIQIKDFYPSVFGSHIIWNDCSIHYYFPAVLLEKREALISSSECVSCNIVMATDLQNGFIGLSSGYIRAALHTCSCLDCKVSIVYDNIPDEFFFRRYNPLSTGYINCSCKKCYAINCCWGYYSCTFEEGGSVAENCETGFGYTRGVYNQLSAINCHFPFNRPEYTEELNKRVYEKCSIVYNDDIEESYYKDPYNYFYGVYRFHGDDCTFNECSFTSHKTIEQTGTYFHSLYYDAFTTFNSLLKNCSVDIKWDFLQDDYWFYMIITGYGGDHNILDTCSFSGSISGNLGGIRIFPVSANNTVHDLSYTCLPECTGEYK